MKCHCCKNERMSNSRYCLRCYVSRVVQSTVGISDKDIRAHYTNELLNKLYTQEFKCHYTGVIMEPGVNLSLDHKMPKSKFPFLAQELSNLVWCDTSVNKAKNDLMFEDFVEMCKLVAAKAEDL